MNGDSPVRTEMRDKKEVLIADGHSYVAGEKTVRQPDGVHVQCWNCVQDCGATVNTVVVEGKHVREGAEEKAALQRSYSKKVAAAWSMRKRTRSEADHDMYAVKMGSNGNYCLPTHLWK